MSTPENHDFDLVLKTAPIKTIFAQLTQMILTSCASSKEVFDHITGIGCWVSVVIASLVLMLGGPQEKALYTIDRITEAMKRDIKKQYVLLRGLQQKVKNEKP